MLLSRIANRSHFSIGRGPSPISTRRQNSQITTAGVKQFLRGSNPDGIGIEIRAGRDFAGG